MKLEAAQGSTTITFTLYGFVDQRRFEREKNELNKRVEQLQPFKSTSYDEWEIDDEEF